MPQAGRQEDYVPPLRSRPICDSRGYVTQGGEGRYLAVFYITVHAYGIPVAAASPSSVDDGSIKGISRIWVIISDLVVFRLRGHHFWRRDRFLCSLEVFLENRFI